MIIGKIEYLNLLPFNLFLRMSGIKHISIYSYPSKINSIFYQKKVDSAFISSIKSKNQRCLDVGIVAHKKVLSVLNCKGEKRDDTQSETSNALAYLLGENGETIIGDKALKVYYKKKRDCNDLATLWYKKFDLPFVFARFCINKDDEKYKKLMKKFLNKKIKIPQYILKREAKQLGISTKNVQEYLDLIYYKMGYKEKKSLKLFLKLSAN